MVISRVVAIAKDIEEMIKHIGQHFDTNMSRVLFEEMFITYFVINFHDFFFRAYPLHYK
jgi:UDP-N-acetylglucosamine 2-epimerase